MATDRKGREIKPGFTPSPGKSVMFPDGKIVNLNRRTRRKLGLYGDRVKEVKLGRRI